MGKRLGLIGDVHGDLPALSWALDAVKARVDRTLCLGDVVDGPADAACIELLQSRDVTVLQGNHDLWASRETRHTEQERQWLRGLPLQVRDDDWLAYHSRYEVTTGDIYWSGLESQISVLEALAATDASVIFCGHTHMPCVNIASPEGGVEYLSTFRLRERPALQLAPGCRYLVNVGVPALCVVVYDVKERALEFTFRSPSASPPAPPS